MKPQRRTTDSCSSPGDSAHEGRARRHHPATRPRTMQLAVDSTTRIWKEEQQVPVKELMAGDHFSSIELDLPPPTAGTAPTSGSAPRLDKLARENQVWRSITASSKNMGCRAWIDSIEGGKLTITFFSGNRKDFASLIGSDPHGQNVYVRLADSELNPTGSRIDKMAFRAHLPEAATAGTYGCSGVRWLLEANPLPEEYAPGRVIRLFKQDWPFPDHRVSSATGRWRGRGRRHSDQSGTRFERCGKSWIRSHPRPGLFQHR